MVEPPPLVGRVPVGRAVGPPTVEKTLRNVLAGDVHPAACLLRLSEQLGLHRRMADDLQEALVVPDVVLPRGDVEITYKDRPARPLRPRPVAHGGDIVELLAELHVLVPVGDVTACRD